MCEKYCGSTVRDASSSFTRKDRPSSVQPPTSVGIEVTKVESFERKGATLLFVLSTLARTVEMFFRLRGAARRSDDIDVSCLGLNLREIGRRACVFR